MVDHCRSWPLALIALALGTMSSAKALDRLELEAAKCSMERNGSEVPCHRLVFRQSDDHALRIRIMGSSTATAGEIRLTFVSQEATNSAALHCNNQSCRLKETIWTGRVNSGSWIAFDQRGLPENPSNAELMTGECQISKKQVICDGQTTDGDVLHAEARL